MPDSALPVPAPHIPPDVIKEIIRLGELRLAAQLQTRLVLEGRLGSSTPWLLAVLVAIASSISSIRSSTEDIKIISTVLTFAVLIAILLNFCSMLISGKWHYSGEVPSSFTKYINLEIRDSRFDLFFKRAQSFIKARIKHPWIVVKYNHDMFEETYYSIDSTLYKLAIHYTNDIARNDDYLSTIKIMANMPIIVLLIGVMIAGYLIPSPKPFPHQPSPTQSSPPAPSQVKPGP